ncbi:unnamed protein product, partial [Brenthis ino]
MLNKRSLELEFKLIIYTEAIPIEVLSIFPIAPFSLNVIYDYGERVYWSEPTSPPHLDNWFHYLYEERRPPAPTGTMKVREGWNVCGTRAGVRAGAAAGDGRTVPGSQARNASASNKAYPPPFTPHSFLAVLPDS